LILSDAIFVMHFLGTVKAKPNSKTFGRKKAAPVIIEKGSIGLNTVSDSSVGGLMSALQRYNFTKVAQAQNGRFSTMPRKPDHVFWGSVNMLNNIFLQNFIGHSKQFALWIELFLVQIVAVVTVQVTDGSDRFSKNLKFAGSLNHC